MSTLTPGGSPTAGAVALPQRRSPLCPNYPLPTDSEEKPPPPSFAGTRGTRVRALDASVLLAALMFVVIAGAALYAVFPRGLPAPVPATAPPAAFSSARALEHVQTIARVPHVMGSRENAAVRDYLIRELSALGLDPQVQRRPAAVTASEAGFPRARGTVAAGRAENVLGRLEGSGTGQAFMLSAHYDSVPGSPGAFDDGGGVATMLETARALKAGRRLRNDVIFLFTDGEERLLLGARAFVDGHPWVRDVGAFLNLESSGNSGPAFMVRTSDGNGRLIRELGKAAPHAVADSFTDAIYRITPVSSDLAVFKAAGLAGMDVANVGGHSTHLHTALDNPAQLDERSLQHMGSYALPLARRLGGLDLADVRESDTTYFTVLGTMVRYPVSFAVPLALLALLAFVGVAALARRSGRLSFGGAAVGFLTLAATMIVAALVAYLAWTALLGLRPALDATAFEHRDRFFWSGVASVSLALTAALYVAVRKHVRVESLAVGALLAWLVLALVTSVALPAASYLFAWPLLFSLLGLGLVLATGVEVGGGWRASGALTLTALPAVVLFVPTLDALTVPQGLRYLPLFAAVLVLMLGLLIPHLALIAAPGKWALPVATAILGVGLLTAGTAMAGFDAKHPRPNNVFYALNADTQKAIFASWDEAPDRWTAQFLGTDPGKGSVATYLSGESAALLHRAVPAAALAAPRLSLRDDSVRDGVRTLRLRLGAPPRASMLTVTTQVGAPIVDAAVDGQRVALEAGERASGRFALLYANPPRALALTLRVEGTRPLSFTARAETPGLPELPGRSYRERPADMMRKPVNAADGDDSTLVSRSLSVSSSSSAVAR